MAIKGITDQGGRLPLIATIRKGAAKDPNKNKPGANLDYFRLDISNAFKTDQLAITEIIGQNPRVIKGVRFLYGSTADEIAPTWFELWGGSKTLYRRCDGETMTRSYTQEDGYTDTPKPCQCNPDNRECRVALRMPFVIEPILRAGILGHFLLVSSSFYDARNIAQTLNGLLELPVPLSAYEFELGRQVTQISYPNPKTGKRGLKEESLVYLRPGDREQTGRLLAAATEHIQRNAANLLSIDDSLALPAGDDNYDEPDVELVEEDDVEVDEPGYQVGDQLTLDVTKVEVVVRDSKRWLWLYTYQGVKVHSWTRKPFRDEGFIDGDDWKEPGFYELSFPISITATLEDSGFWRLTEVSQLPF